MSSSTDNVEKSLVAHGVSWESFGLDPRISRAVAKLGWSHPTLVQSASIPRVLQGKDVLAKARTGSGKTAAYAVPIIQKILADKEGMSVSAGVRAVILVPTRELCEQVSEVITKLAAYCHHLVRHVFLSTDVPMDTQKHRLAELPDIVVATPGRLVQHLEKGHLKLVNSLKMIVIDEADLIFSFGYEKDVEKIVKYLPKISQGFLASATLGASVESLKKLILHTPVVLKLEEEKDKRLLLQQFLVKNSQWNEKYLQLYVLLKLKVISGKTIVFVNSIEGCYRLKLFLERLSVKSAVLNSELPQNSRYHIVQEFNRGLFNVLIATDEANKGEADDSDSESDSASDAGSDSENEEQEQEASSAPSEESSSDSEEEEEEKPSKSKKGAKAASKKAEEKASSKSKKDASNGKSKKEELETATKKKKKSKKQESSDEEDDSASFSGESFEGMDVDDEDDDLEDVDDLEMGSDDASGDEEELEGSDEDSEDQTFESAKKEAEEAIEEIDTYRSVSKNALKVMQERLAAMTKAQEREEAESAAAKSGGAAGGSSSAGGRGRKNGVGSRADEEYGVSRGVDFRGIQTVVNFDFPRSSRAYTHRVGRTARAGQAGTALSFTLNRDEETLAKVTADQKAEGLEIKPYVFNQAAVDSFRYRIEGVLRTVTDLSIREARYEEIRREILGSQKLQTFFEENPREMELLKHDKSLLEKKINPQLKVVPDYIMAQQTPKDMQPLQDKDLDEEFLEHFGARRKGFGKRRLTSDPLKTFSPSTKKHKGPDGKETKRRGGPKGGRGRAPKNVSGRGNGRNGRYSAHVSGGPGT